VKIELPNMNGLPAGSIVNFLSLDHDTNRFEIVATGQAGADGVMRSDCAEGRPHRSPQATGCPGLIFTAATGRRSSRRRKPPPRGPGFCTLGEDSGR
jgi:hypothetical protein